MNEQSFVFSALTTPNTAGGTAAGATFYGSNRPDIFGRISIWSFRTGLFTFNTANRGPRNPFGTYSGAKFYASFSELTTCLNLKKTQEFIFGGNVKTTVITGKNEDISLHLADMIAPPGKEGSYFSMYAVASEAKLNNGASFQNNLYDYLTNLYNPSAETHAVDIPTVDLSFRNARITSINCNRSVQLGFLNDRDINTQDGAKLDPQNYRCADLSYSASRASSSTLIGDLNPGSDAKVSIENIQVPSVVSGDLNFKNGEVNYWQYKRADGLLSVDEATLHKQVVYGTSIQHHRFCKGSFLQTVFTPSYAKYVAAIGYQDNKFALANLVLEAYGANFKTEINGFDLKTHITGTTIDRFLGAQMNQNQGPVVNMGAAHFDFDLIRAEVSQLVAREVGMQVDSAMMRLAKHSVLVASSETELSQRGVSVSSAAVSMSSSLHVYW